MTDYVALDDYTATDADEASFVKGDVITGVIPYPGAEGWFTGTIARTEEWGYVIISPHLAALALLEHCHSRRVSDYCCSLGHTFPQIASITLSSTMYF